LHINAARTLADAALDGLGLAYVFEQLVGTLLEQGRLVRVLEVWCPDSPGFFLYDPSRRQLPVALRAFIDFTRTGRSEWCLQPRRGARTHGVFVSRKIWFNDYSKPLRTSLVLDCFIRRVVE
jgi:hypothetical protein